VKSYEHEYLKDPVHRKLITNEISNLRLLQHSQGIVKLKGIYESKRGIQLVTSYAGDKDL
jgi:serine/threonine protein kinase